MIVEVRLRFVGPLRLTIDGEISDRSLDIEMLGRLVFLSVDAEITTFWIASLTDRIECVSIIPRPKIEALLQCPMM